MKLILVFLVTIFLQEGYTAKAQTITLSKKNISLHAVLKEIRKQTGYDFFYNEGSVEEAKRIDIDVQNGTLEHVLKLSFKNQPLTYSISGNAIIVKGKPRPVKKESILQQSVQGKVVDDENRALPGVSVTNKESGKTVTTNDEGQFSILANSSDVLNITYVGFIPQEISIGNQLEIQVSLKPLISNLEEVVVIGYGTKLKGELTGSVAKVSNKVFETRPITNTLNALQGAMPGVTITRGSGGPGKENYSLQIRGASSISGSKPLVLIDGVPGDLGLLNPNDIADVTVLKDAAASIYGARAADGVVLVTTKKGRKGSPSIMYSGNYGVKDPQYLKKRTSTLQLAEMYDEGMRNVGLPGVTQDVFDKIRANAEPDPTGWLKYLENFPGFYQSHDWIDDVYGTGVQQSHNVSISGGGDNNTYLFSVGYSGDEGVFKYGENKSDRYNLRMNYDFKLFDQINLETRTSFDNQGVVEPTGLANALYFVNQVGSYVPIYNPSGQLYKYQGGFRNPIQHLQEAGIRQTSQSRLATNVKGDVKLFSDLQLVLQAGINIDFNNGSTTNPSFNQYNWDGSLFDVANALNSASYTNAKNTYKIATGYLDYTKVLGQNHKFNVMVGASHEVNDNQNQNITGYNFASNEIFTLNLADRTKTEYANFSGFASDWALSSFFGRFSYAYNKKYLIDFTTRMDGSSKFARNKRWSALFPSVALAWNLTEESAIQSLNVFDNLKLRGSWGQSGNQELSFGNYDYISLISITGSYPLGSPKAGLPGAVSNIASEERTWETIETKNVGLDVAFFESRLSGSIDFYLKSNKNMLVVDQLPATLGGTAPTQNIGKLETKGWDFSLGWADQKGNFRYSVNAMISDSKNKLLELKGNDSYSEGLVKVRKGYSLNSYFGYQYEGIIQNAEQLASYKQLENVPTNISLGDVMYKDIDGDGKITAFGDPLKGTTGDMTYLGNLLPRYTYSANINLGYKRVDVSVLLQGIGKRDGIRTGEFSYPFTSVWMQPLEYFYGKNWTPTNPGAMYPRIIPGEVGFNELRDWNWRTSAMRMNNLAYLKLKVITVAYNLPETLINKVKMQSVRVYASGQDLFTFSKDTWNGSFNPEETWERSDEQTYPFSGVVSLGLDIRF